jgi:hypothetical protein
VTTDPQAEQRWPTTTFNGPPVIITVFHQQETLSAARPLDLPKLGNQSIITPFDFPPIDVNPIREDFYPAFNHGANGLLAATTLAVLRLVSSWRGVN